MNLQGIAQIALYLLLGLAITKPLGAYMQRAFDGERTLLSPVLRPLEALIYRLCGVDENACLLYTSDAADE